MADDNPGSERPAMQHPEAQHPVSEMMAGELQTDRITEAIIGTPKYTPEDVARTVGMSLDDATRLWIELGFPPVADDNRHFTDADIEVLKMLRELQTSLTLDEDIIIPMTRVLGQALARVAYAQAESLNSSLIPISDALDEGGGRGEGGSTVRPRFELDEESLPAITHMIFDGKFERFLSYAWRRHLAEAVRRKLEAKDSEYIIGFADLVGFTGITTRIEQAELPALISRFERAAYSHVASAGGRVLKLIGDAVMFTVPDPPSAAKAGLGLRHIPTEDAALPKVRVGLAMGPAVGMEGDLFGDTVNRANRLCDVAKPGTVLVDDDLGRLLDGRDDVMVRALRPRKLKGLGYVRAWVLRQVENEEG
jgi:adenylate cyclase